MNYVTVRRNFYWPENWSFSTKCGQPTLTTGKCVRHSEGESGIPKPKPAKFHRSKVMLNGAAKESFNEGCHLDTLVSLAMSTVGNWTASKQLFVRNKARCSFPTVHVYTL